MGYLVKKLMAYEDPKLRDLNLCHLNFFRVFAPPHPFW